MSWCEWNKCDKKMHGETVKNVNYSLLLCVANLLNIKKILKTAKYFTLNLPSCSRAVANLFQALSLAILSLYDFLLRSYITGKLRTQYINFSSNFSLQLMVYKKHNFREQATTLPACCLKNSASSRRSQGSDAATARRCGIVRSVTAGHLWARQLKNQARSKPQLWILRARITLTQASLRGC